MMSRTLHSARQPIISSDVDGVSGMVSSAPSEEYSEDQPSTLEQASATAAAVDMVKTLSASSHGTVSQSTISCRSSADLDKPSRPKRKRITPEQLRILLAYFAQTETPSYELRDTIGAEVGMSNREVQIWCQNRRAKQRLLRQKDQAQGSGQSGYPAEVQSSSASSSYIAPPQEFRPDARFRHLSANSSLPPYIEAGRRRSLSTSALLADAYSSETIMDGHYDYRSRVPTTADAAVSSAGPARPRFVRVHSNTNLGPYPRTFPSSASVWSPRHSRAPVGASLATDSGSPPSNMAASTDLWPSMGLSTPAELDAPPRWLLPQPPLPQPTSLEFGRPASPSLPSLADRRQTQLPPIKLLLDIADRAASPSGSWPASSTLGPSSAQSCPGLISPFERLEMASPGHPRSGYSDGGGRSYFHDRTPTQNNASPPVFNPSFRFGTSFADNQ